MCVYIVLNTLTLNVETIWKFDLGLMCTESLSWRLLETPHQRVCSLSGACCQKTAELAVDAWGIPAFKEGSEDKDSEKKDGKETSERWSRTLENSALRKSRQKKVLNKRY